MSDVINGVSRELLERLEHVTRNLAPHLKCHADLTALLTAQPQASAAQSAHHCNNCLGVQPESCIFAQSAPAVDTPSSDDYAQAIKALEAMDWSGVALGTKVVLGRIRDLLWHAQRAQSAPAGEREAFGACIEKHFPAPTPPTGTAPSAVRERERLLAIMGECFQAGAAWQRTQSAGVPDGWKLVKIGHGCVTSSMKAACIGEFSFGITMACGECVDCGADSDCPVCGGEVEYTQRITVPWDTCKEIYKAMLAAAPAQPAAQVEFGDAYQGAREELAIWKRRALEAEDSVRELEARIDTLILDCQGESRMGEPVIPAAQDQGEVQRLREALEEIRHANMNGPVSESNAGCIKRIEQIAERALAASTGQEVVNDKP